MIVRDVSGSIISVLSRNFVKLDGPYDLLDLGLNYDLDLFLQVSIRLRQEKFRRTIKYISTKGMISLLSFTTVDLK